jgi:hypothetical protein
MKKIIQGIFIILISFILVSCRNRGDNLPKENTKQYRTEVKTDVSDVVLEELELGLKFFWETANDDRNSPGYGLIPDRFHVISDKVGDVASIASVGFGLTTLPISIESGYISRKEAEERAYYTLETIKNMERVHGFWYHFVSMKTGKRSWKCEVSIIDSTILINGALSVGQYFGGRVEKLARELYEAMEWNWYYDSDNYKFYMGYWPERGFEGYWDSYAEQLMIFVLAAGSPTYPVDQRAYHVMKAISKLQNATPQYGSFYETHTGSLFVYQFSHAWIDFRDIVDRDGFNWFTNSVHAVEAAINFATLKTDEFQGLNKNSWGLSACDGPNGYVGPYGSGPVSTNANIVDGTVPAYGAAGSMVFKPEEAANALKNYKTFDRFNSKYGFVDAYNLGQNWFGNDIIAIDKGISVLMIENYLSDMVWNIFMEIDYIQNGLETLKFKRLEE